MNIYAVDIETHGLDTHKFICGSIMGMDYSCITFDSKKKLWEHILSIGMANHAKKSITYIYAHNHIYDFYAYANLKDSHIKYICTKPFIAIYEVENKPIIKFLDTLAIYKMPLLDIGKLVGTAKWAMPKQLLR